jgi:hypothetical protein
MLREVGQAGKDKGNMFSSHIWRIDPKDKCIHKTNMIIYTSMYIHITCL